MTGTDSPAATSDERLMAAVAHLFGLIAALVVWITQKDKSRFVRFQTVQAMAFDGVVMILPILFGMCLPLLLVIGMIAAGVSTGSSPSPQSGWVPLALAGGLFPFVMMLCLMPLALLIFAVRCIAAVSVATGRNFRYPLIARRVEEFLREE